MSWLPVHADPQMVALALILGVSLLVMLFSFKVGALLLAVLVVLNLGTVTAAAPKAWASRDEALAVAEDVLSALQLEEVTHVSTEVTSASVGLRCGGVEPVLATIRKMESGGNYQARNKHASAAGAYQFVDGTWRGLGGTDFPGRHDAAQASPEEQDRIAGGYVQRILDTHAGDVGVVPLVWYMGDATPEMDRVPSPAGNTLTPRQYQTRWLAEYERQTAACGGV